MLNPIPFFPCSASLKLQIQSAHSIRFTQSAHSIRTPNMLHSICTLNPLHSIRTLNLLRSIRTLNPLHSIRTLNPLHSIRTPNLLRSICTPNMLHSIRIHTLPPCIPHADLMMQTFHPPLEGPKKAKIFLSDYQSLMAFFGFLAYFILRHTLLISKLYFCLSVRSDRGCKMAPKSIFIGVCHAGRKVFINLIRDGSANQKY